MMPSKKRRRKRVVLMFSKNQKNALVAEEAKFKKNKDANKTKEEDKTNRKNSQNLSEPLEIQ
jgi:hypothetical protein